MIQLFDFFSLLILFCMIMIMMSYNPIHSMFWLVLTFLFSSSLLMSMNLNFLSLSMMIIYVGAMAMLFLFVIMMLDLVNLEISLMKNLMPMMIIILMNMLMKMLLLNNMKLYKNIFFYSNWNMKYSNHINMMGNILYSDYFYPFMMMSMMLFMAMMGAMILTLEMNKLTKKQNLISQHQS